MTDDGQYKRFSRIDFEGFRQLARDETMSRYEKIGFPNTYREGLEAQIFADIQQKLSNLGQKNQIVLDIGPGCSDLPQYMIDLCRQQGHTLILVDSQEMLDHLPDESFVIKIPARYPDECPQLFAEYAGRVNVILTYSVLQYVFAEGSVFAFVDQSLTLLAEGGQMLIGDIPNISKRKRFFGSPAGIRFHQAFMQTSDEPQVTFNVAEPDHIDDGVLLGLMWRCRAAGFDSYVMPQRQDLPMANRREDMLIIRP